MAAPKILVTGKNGQVGFELQRSLAVLGQVVAVDREACDLSRDAAILATLEREQPDIIVNPAAYTAVDKAESEPEPARQLNARAPALLAQWAAQHGALLVHYSTDYVFDGSKDGWYSEDDEPSPTSVYGRTKLDGEIAVRDSGCRHLILRTSWVFGAHGNNFLKTMLRLMQEREALSIVADQVGSPTSAALLADITAQLVAQYWRAGDKDAFAYGTYHAVADGATSWHGYARHIHRVASAMGQPVKLGVDAIAAIPSSAYPAPARRPANSRLATGKLKQTFNLELPHWQQGVEHVLTVLCAGNSK